MSGSGGGIEAAWYRGDNWLWLLRPLELLFRLVVSLRSKAYGRGLFRAYRADKPVVIVGNITVGGTGKTPVVIALCEALQAQGFKPGVVSRGYGAKAGPETFPHTVDENSTADQCGDEPLLIFRRTGVPVVVAPKRPVACRALLQDKQVDIVLSDDGLQHYPLARDLEIVLIDGDRGLGNGFCLPAGPLREPPARLRSVDHILYRNGDAAASGVSYLPDCWINLASGEQRSLVDFVGVQKPLAIAGIGQPQQFFDNLEGLGLNPETRVFPDHYQYRASDFAGTQGRTILMTEKDAVKCMEFAGPDSWYLRIKAQLPESVLGDVLALARSGSPDTST